jgi:hypothetical protein
MNRVLRITSLVGIVFLAMLVIGCTNKKAIAAEMIAGVQKDVPFTIIVPTYFPSDVKVIPIGIYGPGTNEVTHSVNLGITYYGSNSEKFIVVTEEKVNTSWVPTHPSITYNINGVEVMSQSVAMGSATKITNGIMYVWNRNGINFEVDVYGYDQTEGKKIVESMIK